MMQKEEAIQHSLISPGKIFILQGTSEARKQPFEVVVLFRTKHWLLRGRFVGRFVLVVLRPKEK